MRLVWKNFPLDFHKDAPLAHAAAVAAQQQGKFWEFHDKVFANQPKIKAEDLRQYAREIGLDVARFEKDIVNPDVLKLIDQDKREVSAVGVTGTPSFFVNGRFLSGAKPFEEFAKAINAELARLNLPIPAAAAGK